MAADSNDSMELARIQRLVEILIKLKLVDIQGERTQKEMILLLGGLGCNANEISELLGAPRTSVAPVLSRAKVANRGK